MKRFAWLTDIHLNYVPAEQVDGFLRQLAALRLDGLFIGGDIAEAHDICDHLARLDEQLKLDVYFVLGNHDYYYGSVGEVRHIVGQLVDRRPRLHYLSTAEPLALAPGVGLVGHDGWADGRLGDYEKSVVSMYDSHLIGDLLGKDKSERWHVLKAFGDAAAAHIRKVLPEALAQFDEVLLLTHVPPLREACWHEGRISDDQWAPFFTCQAMGEAILEIMRDHPHQRLTVLCGHTHGSGEVRPLENVDILTGGAEYGQPHVQRVLEFAAPQPAEPPSPAAPSQPAAEPPRGIRPPGLNA